MHLKVSCILCILTTFLRAEADTDDLGAGGAGRGVKICRLPSAETPGAEADADEDISILWTGGVDSGVDG